MAEEKILGRVQKLLDKANANGTTDAERQLLLDKADELMIKHAIDEAMLMASMSKNERRKPISERFQAASRHSPHWEKFRTVLWVMGDLQRVRVAVYTDGSAMLVGFMEDVEYLKMKWLNIYLHFSKTIDPSWDNSLPPEQNVYNFKTAGRQWQDIQYAALSNGIDRPFHWFKPAYQRHCRHIGEQPTKHTQRNFAYRESFTTAFVNRICARIEVMRFERDRATSEAGALVAVKDLGVEIDDLFYTLFPHHRSLTAEELAAHEAQREKEREEHMRWLGSLSPEARSAYDAQQEANARREAKKSEKYWREQDKKFDDEGARLGRTSANNVDLSRNAAAAAAPSRREL